MASTYTQADLDAFDAEQKKRGTITGFTSISGESVTFASPDESMRYRAKLAALVGESASPPRNIRYAVIDKGV